MKRFLLSILSLAMVIIAVSGHAFADPAELEPWQTAYLNVLTEERENTADDDEFVSYALYDIDRRR